MTTVDFYPNAHPETNTVDGYASRESQNTIWSTIRGGSGNWNGDADTSFYIDVHCSTTNNQFSDIRRGIFLFPTGATIPVGATITSVTLSLYAWTKFNNCGDTDANAGLAVVSSNPASPTAIAAGDFTSLGSTDYATRIPQSGISTNSYTVFTLLDANSDGYGYVAKGSGVTKLGVRVVADLINTAPPWVSNAWEGVGVYGAEQGTTYRPKLTVTYTTGTAYSDTAAVNDKVSVVAANSEPITAASAVNDKVSVVAAEPASIDITAIGDITGDPTVGSLLTAGALTPADATATYQWWRLFNLAGLELPIDGATDATYTLTSDDEVPDDIIFIAVEAIGFGDYTGDVASDFVGPVYTAYVDTLAVNDKVSVAASNSNAGADVCAVTDKVSVVVANSEPLTAISAVTDKISVVVTDAEVAAIAAAVNDKISVVAQIGGVAADVCAVNDKVSVTATGAEVEALSVSINDKISVAAANSLAVAIAAAVNDKVSVGVSNAQTDTATVAVNDKVSVAAADVYTPAHKYIETAAVGDKVSVVASSIQVSSATASVSDKVSVTTAPSIGTTLTASINDKISVTFTDRYGRSIVTAVYDKVSVVTTDISGGSASSNINDKVSVVASNVWEAGIIAAVNDKVRVFMTDVARSQFGGMPQFIDWFIEDAKYIDWAIDYIMKMDWSL